MQNQNIIDLSEFPLQDRTLVLDFLSFLKFKRKNYSNLESNYDKDKLLSAFEKARNPKIFKQIDDSVAWQKEIRDEWE
jgi:hypothetical protein